ncbi:MAG: glycyl-tRNA synthetase, beta subunit, partial [Nitrospirae bacterium]|nr:glycyl-tRNA synthetase, beta subunit [Nitrospirota bacterium]
AKEFLLEIGTEEIPSRFVGPALEKMKELFSQLLASGRVGSSGEIKTYGTPRRLVLHVPELDEQQADMSKEVLGPPKKIAFDADGKPTKAALVFAEKNNVTVDALGIRATDKGEYVVARIDEKGGDTAAWLGQVLPGFILSIPFPKSMRWMDKDIRFARPIHWVLAIYGGAVVPFELGGIKSGNVSRGHRFMSPGAFMVKDFKSYQLQAEPNFVVMDPEVRKARIMKQVEELAKTKKGMVLEDSGLVDEVTNLVEYPVAVMGSFSKDFLRVPKEVLITAMREHQRYFSVVDDQGNLLPYFITISNTRAEDMAVVQAGNERVLTARMSDAAYFFDHDLKVPLAARVEGLKKVTYQEKLGSVYDKTERVKKLTGHLAAIMQADARTAERAAYLAKADLLSGVVGEFPKLQGVMGSKYAVLSGEDPQVAAAIAEHYLPRFAGDALPGSLEGMCVGIADRIDTITGCFAVGLVPSGSEDPYGLRRQSVAILSMLFDRGLHLSLAALVAEACKGHGLKKADQAKVESEVLDFLRQRLAGLLTTEGLRSDVVDAALAGTFDDPLVAKEKVRALDAWRTSDDYRPLVTALKRAGNIVPKDFAGAVKKGLLKEEAEKDLFTAYTDIKDRVKEKTAKLDFRGALADIASLRNPVDAFFDKVMVMDKDAEVKQNRLALLAGITGLFSMIADFSRLVLSAEEK